VANRTLAYSYRCEPRTPPGLERTYGRTRTRSRYEHSEIEGVVFGAALTLVCTHRRHVIRQAMRGTIVTVANASVEINKRPLPVPQLPGRARQPARDDGRLRVNRDFAMFRLCGSPAASFLDLRRWSL
jgi:hypothetical protein